MTENEFNKPLSKFVQKPSDIGTAAVKLMKALEPKVDAVQLARKLDKTGNPDYLLCDGLEEHSEYIFKGCAIAKANLLYTKAVRYLAVSLRMTYEKIEAKMIPVFMRMAEKHKPQELELQVAEILLILLHVVQEAEARNLKEIRRRLHTSNSMMQSQHELCGLLAASTATAALFPKGKRSPGIPTLPFSTSQIQK